MQGFNAGNAMNETILARRRIRAFSSTFFKNFHLNLHIKSADLLELNLISVQGEHRV